MDFRPFRFNIVAEVQDGDEPLKPVKVTIEIWSSSLAGALSILSDKLSDCDLGDCN